MTPFDLTTVLVPAAEGRFGAEADPSWSSLHGLHGGYRVALAVRAAGLTHADRAVRTVSSTFERPGAAGPVDIDVEVLRHTRSFTTADLTIRQDGVVLARCRTTATAGPAGTGGRHDWTAPPLEPPPPRSACVPFDPPPHIAHFQHAELLLDPAHLPFSGAPRARLAGWLRPREAAFQQLDAPWLAMAGDWLPPTPFTRLDPPAGGISIDYTAHIHATAPPLGHDGWLMGAFEVRTSRAGMALETGGLATADGVPLVEVFHTRWTG